jgi:hypothetical protein
MEAGSIYIAGRALALLAGFGYHSESFALPLRNTTVFAVLKLVVSPTYQGF